MLKKNFCGHNNSPSIGKGGGPNRNPKPFYGTHPPCARSRPKPQTGSPLRVLAGVGKAITAVSCQQYARIARVIDNLSGLKGQIGRFEAQMREISRTQVRVSAFHCV